MATRVRGNWSDLDGLRTSVLLGLCGDCCAVTKMIRTTVTRPLMFSAKLKEYLKHLAKWNKPLRLCWCSVRDSCCMFQTVLLLLSLLLPRLSSALNQAVSFPFFPPCPSVSRYKMT
eukprot:765718-Hanusia_phi.AAC.1